VAATADLDEIGQVVVVAVAVVEKPALLDKQIPRAAEGAERV
jgi:hypothetical protein